MEMIDLQRSADIRNTFGHVGSLYLQILFTADQFPALNDRV
jgi:hypothetical protein